MTIIEKAQIQHFHSERIKCHGDMTAEAQGWKDINSQQKRFEVLMRIADLNHRVVLDLGCGYGDLKPFLDRSFQGFSYIGVDHIPDFIEKAKSKYEDHERTYFVQGDYTHMQFQGVDYILASGALSYQSENEVYYFRALEHMINIADQGVAFNMLDDRFFPAHPLLKAHNREEVTRFCRQHCQNVEVIDGYMPDDFTIFIRK